MNIKAPVYAYLWLLRRPFLCELKYEHENNKADSGEIALRQEFNIIIKLGEEWDILLIHRKSKSVNAAVCHLIFHFSISSVAR
jgi:hypothetical protein